MSFLENPTMDYGKTLRDLPRKDYSWLYGASLWERFYNKPLEFLISPDDTYSRNSFLALIGEVCERVLQKSAGIKSQGILKRLILSRDDIALQVNADLSMVLYCGKARYSLKDSDSKEVAKSIRYLVSASNSDKVIIELGFFYIINFGGMSECFDYAICGNRVEGVIRVAYLDVEPGFYDMSAKYTGILPPKLTGSVRCPGEWRRVEPGKLRCLDPYIHLLKRWLSERWFISSKMKGSWFLLKEVNGSPSIVGSLPLKLLDDFDNIYNDSRTTTLIDDIFNVVCDDAMPVIHSIKWDVSIISGAKVECFLAKSFEEGAYDLWITSYLSMFKDPGTGSVG